MCNELEDGKQKINLECVVTSSGALMLVQRKTAKVMEEIVVFVQGNSK